MLKATNDTCLMKLELAYIVLISIRFSLKLLVHSGGFAITVQIKTFQLSRMNATLKENKTISLQPSSTLLLR